MIYRLRNLYENVFQENKLDQRYFSCIKEENVDCLNEIFKSRLKETGFVGSFFSGSLGDRGYIYNRAEQNGIWTSRNRETAEEYATMGGNADGVIRSVALKFESPLDLRPLGVQSDTDTVRNFLKESGVELPEMYYEAFQSEIEYEEQDTWFVYSIIDGRNWKADRKLAIDVIKSAGYDSMILSDTHYKTQSDSYVLFDSSQVKLLNLITKGDDGNIIPISHRLTDSPDIRY